MPYPRLDELANTTRSDPKNRSRASCWIAVLSGIVRTHGANGPFSTRRHRRPFFVGELDGYLRGRQIGSRGKVALESFDREVEHATLDFLRAEPDVTFRLRRSALPFRADVQLLRRLIRSVAYMDSYESFGQGST